MTDTPNFNEQVEQQIKALAVMENEDAERTKVAEIMRDRFYDFYIKPYTDEIAGRAKAIADKRAEIKAEVEAHFLATGEKPTCKAIQVSVSKPMVIDKDAALVWLQEVDEATGVSMRDFDISPYKRVKTELNVVPFKAALKDGKIEWNGAEAVQKVTVALDGKLGEYAIIAELEAKVEAKAEPQSKSFSLLSPWGASEMRRLSENKAAPEKAEPAPEPKVKPAEKPTPPTPEFKRGMYAKNAEGKVGLLRKVDALVLTVWIVDREARFVRSECTISNVDEYQGANKSSAA